MAYTPITPSLEEKDIPSLIESLIDFLGNAEVEQALRRYTNGKIANKSRPIYDYYYYSLRHPWFETFKDFKRLKERNGRYTAPNLDTRLRSTAIDSSTIQTLLDRTRFPASVRDQYRRDLLDQENGYFYLFELYVALHYLTQGGEIDWVEGQGTKPEFTVRIPDYVFQVECKYITFDKGKNFRRRDFHTLADMLFPKLFKLKLQGEIDIEYSERLPSNEASLQAISKAIVEGAKNNQTVIRLEGNAGEVKLALREQSKLILDEFLYRAELESRKPGTTIAISAPTYFQNPLALSFRTTQPPRIVDYLWDTMRGARTQFSEATPGVITIFFEGIRQGDLETMNNREGFQGFNYQFFESENSKNIIAVTYAAGPFARDTFYGANISMDGVSFINPNCPNQPPEDYKFIKRSQA